MPSKNRVTVNLSSDFLALVKAYQEENKLKSLAEAIANLAAIGLGQDVEPKAQWGGSRK